MNPRGLREARRVIEEYLRKGQRGPLQSAFANCNELRVLGRILSLLWSPEGVVSRGTSRSSSSMVRVFLGPHLAPPARYLRQGPRARTRRPWRKTGFQVRRATPAPASRLLRARNSPDTGRIPISRGSADIRAPPFAGLVPRRPPLRVYSLCPCSRGASSFLRRPVVVLVPAATPGCNPRLQSSLAGGVEPPPASALGEGAARWTRGPARRATVSGSGGLTAECAWNVSLATFPG